MRFCDELFNFAMQLADAASEISCRYFRQKVVIDTKNGNFPVTKVDLEIESTLRQMIKSKYPKHSIIGEEYAADIVDGDEYSWVIDPIDGTVAFTTGKPTFTTLIALIKNDKPIFGIIDQAITKERFIGITGIAAYQIENLSFLRRDGSNQDPSVPATNSVIHAVHEVTHAVDETVHSALETITPAIETIYPEVGAVIPAQAGIHALNIDYQIMKSSIITDVSLARLNATTPDMFTPDEMSKFTRLKNQVKVCAWGGDAYAYAMLASGHIDIIMESQLQYYDVAALVPIITASGGIITTWGGDQITPDFKGQCLASSNMELHNHALKIINENGIL